ncbi:MAG: tetratricopeptide repeat protein [Sandaracinaceae bacterium]
MDASLEHDKRYRLDLRVLRFRGDKKRDEPALLARDLLAKGRSDEALELTSAALEDDPSDTDLLLVHGIALAKSGQLATAQLALTRAAKEDPEWVEPWRLLAEVLWQRGKHARALQVARRGLAVDPGDESLSRIQKSASLELRARSYLFAPNDEEPAMLAQELLSDNRADLAFEVTRTALLEELDDVDLLVVHARAAIAMRDLDEAINALSMATYGAADWPEVWKLLATAHEQKGEPDRARQAAFEGLCNNPGDVELKRLHARLEGQGETLVTM